MAFSFAGCLRMSALGWGMTIRTIRAALYSPLCWWAVSPLIDSFSPTCPVCVPSRRDRRKFSSDAEQAADRLTMLVQSEVQGVRFCIRAVTGQRQPVEAANLSYVGEWSDTQRLIQDRAKEWERGHDNAAGLLNSENCRAFFLETKVRDGDKMVGLLITDWYGALVAASSEPDHYLLSHEPWWEALQAGGLTASTSAG